MLSGNDLIFALNRLGYNITIVPYNDWRENALGKIKSSPEDPSAKLAGFFFGENNITDPVFSCEKTLLCLGEQDFEPPPILNFDLLSLYISFFVRLNYFPPPEGVNK